MRFLCFHSMLLKPPAAAFYGIFYRQKIMPRATLHRPPNTIAQ